MRYGKNWICHPVRRYRYSLLRIYGTAKDRDEERTLLNEIACGLGDLALVRKNGIALEEMCNGNGEFYDEYQEQFNILYDGLVRLPSKRTKMPDSWEKESSTRMVPL